MPLLIQGATVLASATGRNSLADMMRFVETIWLVFFLLGLLVLGVLGTWPETAPFWYGAGFIAVAGMGSLISRQGPPAEAVGWKRITVMALLACYLGWRGFTSEVIWLARQDLVFAGTAVIVYGLVAVRFTSPRARLGMLVVLFLLVAGNTGLGLYQYFSDPRMTIFRWFGLRRAAEVSAGGFFESGNHMAGFMTMAGLPLLGVAVLGKGLGNFIRAGAAAGFVLSGVGVAFSTSRGGVAGFFAAMGLLIVMCAILWWSGKRRHRGQTTRLGAYLIGLGIVFLGLLAGAGFVLKKVFGNADNLASLNGRGPLWDAALEQWQLAPFLGTGARSYEYMERGFRTLDTKWMTWAGEVDAVFAHNDYLQCLADYGMVGLGLVLLVAGTHLWAAIHSVMAGDEKEAGRTAPGLPAGLALGAAAGLCGIMIQALVEFNMHIGINAVMAGLLLGLMATPGFRKPLPTMSPKPVGEANRRPRVGAGFSGPRLAAGGVIAALSLLLLESGWQLAPADYAWRQGKKQLTTAITLPDLIAASGTFQRATSLDPLNPHAWDMRGRVSLQIASLTAEKYARPFYEASLTQLKQSLSLYPKNPYAASQAGSVAGYLGRMEEADHLFSTALRWGLTIQSVNEMYGDFLLRRKEYYKAMGYLIVALHQSGDADVRENLQRKVNFGLKQLKQQGIAPPAGAFISPSTP